jgi:hypothetical protein
MYVAEVRRRNADLAAVMAQIICAAKPRGIGSGAGNGMFLAILASLHCRSLTATEPCLPAAHDDEGAERHRPKRSPNQQRPRRPFAEFSQVGGSGFWRW